MPVKPDGQDGGFTRASSSHCSPHSTSQSAQAAEPRVPSLGFIPAIPVTTHQVCRRSNVREKASAAIDAAALAWPIAGGDETDPVRHRI